MNKIVLMIVLLSSVDVFAESISTIPWSALELSEQEILRKAESDWDNYPPARQQKLLNGARKWGALSPENRQLMRRNQQYLKRLNPQRRQRLLNRMKRFRALPDVEKIRLRDTFRKFKRLPVQKRRQLRAQWKKNPRPSDVNLGVSQFNAIGQRAVTALPMALRGSASASFTIVANNEQMEVAKRIENIAATSSLSLSA
jgi:hypothetical protein